VKLEYITGRNNRRTVVVEMSRDGYLLVPEDFGAFGPLSPDEADFLRDGGVIDPAGRQIRLVERRSR
jgi:hypothetical protein